MLEKSKFEGGEIYLEKQAGNQFAKKLAELKSVEQANEQSGIGRMNMLKGEIKESLILAAIGAGVNPNEIKSLDKESLAKVLKSPEKAQELLDKLDAKYKAIEAIDKEYTVNGVHFLKCQFYKIIEALKDGKRVEFEAFGPYLRDYLDDIWGGKVNYKKTDAIGLAIMEFLKKKVIPEGHAISLYDEYNLWSVASAKVLGQSVSKEQADQMRKKMEELAKQAKSKDKEEKNLRTEVKQLLAKAKKNPVDALLLNQQAEEKLKQAETIKKEIVTLTDEKNSFDTFTTGRLENQSQILKDKFKEFVRQSMFERGIIKDVDVEGPDNDYVLLSESEKVADAKELVKKLNELGLIEGDITSETGELWFQTNISNCDDPRYLRINLRNKQGTWQCAALDASGFLNPRNRDITHLVILPKENFEQQQDSVWEILHALGFSPDNYHNIFFETENPEVTPETVVETLRSQISVLAQ